MSDWRGAIQPRKLERKPQPTRHCEKCFGYGIFVAKNPFREDNDIPLERKCEWCNGVGWVV